MLNAIKHIDKWETVKTEVSDEGSIGAINKNGKVIGSYEFDRDSDAFWVNDLTGAGQISFDTKEEMINYFKKHFGIP